MRILDLYAGLGGNRKLWPDGRITAIENNAEIAKFYKDHFPRDRVIVTDAHEYLLKHYFEFDFIWSSIECPSHSRARFWASKGKRYAPVFPDMRLYEEILFLKHYFDGLWVVENVKPYYKPLLEATADIERHLFWANFKISDIYIYTKK
jgi:DNA (cytosine-5)-methyltransferase 1